MAKGFIVEELRVTGGTMRLRDSRTGETVEVPLTLGAALAIPGARPDVPGEDAASEKEEEGEVDAADEADADGDAKPRKRRKKKRHAKKAAEAAEAGREETPEEPMPAARAAVPESPVPEDPTPVVDESTLTDEDKAAVERFRALVSKPSTRGKRGALGWQETTVDGRSGLLARWGKGQFKILHAGADTYALFYEWDGGKWERIACGSPEDLMRLAAARAEDEQPKAPLTTLTLEVARLFCGTNTQKEAAREQLRPVRTPRKPAAAKPAATKQAAAKPATDQTPPQADSETEAMDKELMSSFTDELDKVLAEEDD